MTTLQNQSASTQPSSPVDGSLPDKKFLYGRYQGQEDWQNDLHRKLCHKSLDIPEDPETINAPRTTTITNTGLGKLGAVGLAGGSLLGGGGVTAAALAAYQLFKDRPAAVAPVNPGGPVDSEYEVRHYYRDANGNYIRINQQPLPVGANIQGDSP